MTGAFCSSWFTSAAVAAAACCCCDISCWNCSAHKPYRVSHGIVYISKRIYLRNRR